MPQSTPLRSKLYSVTLSAIFGLTILVGLVGAFVPYDSVPAMQELRRLATFPSPGEFKRPTLIPNRITAFFADNFGGRKPLVREYFRFRLRLLKSDVGLDVVLGNYNSLVLTGELRSSRHLHAIAPERLERMRRLLDSWCSYARARNAAFVFLIAPNKTTVHPLIPAYLPVADRPSVIDAIYTLPLDCPVIKVDLRGPLRREAGKLLYFKWGTHWNAHGSLTMWRAIREAVEREGPRLSWPTSKVMVTQRPAAPHEDSMWPWYGLPDPEQIMLNQYTFHETKYETVAGTVPAPRARILAFGDSFLAWSQTTASELVGDFSVWSLSPRERFNYKAEDLRKDGWILSAHPHQKRIEIMDIFRPNVVILEIVERSIEELADFLPPPDVAK